jgi:hypothetical protein
MTSIIPNAPLFFIHTDTSLKPLEGIFRKKLPMKLESPLLLLEVAITVESSRTI